MSELTFRTRPPAHYIAPSIGEMEEAARQVGLSGFSKSLAADLCNLAAGGSVCPPSSYRSAVERQADDTLPAPNDKGEWLLKSGYTTSNREMVVAERTAQAMRYHQNVCDFLQVADVGLMPGATPLAQVMNYLKLLSKQQGGSGESGSGDTLPIFTDSDRPERVAETVHDLINLAESLGEEEQEMLDPDGRWNEQSPEGDGERNGSSGLSAMKAAEDMVEGSEARTILEISRHLEQFTKLQVRRQKLVRPDLAGYEVRSRPIRGLNELSRVAPQSWALRQVAPTEFLRRVVTGQLPVRERVTREERRQAIFILVDGSHSMSGRKHYKATGVVMSRLKAALAGDAVVWVSVFDTQMNEPGIADSPESAKELMQKFRRGNYRGGGTDIAAAIKAAHRFIEEKMKAGEALWRPEVVVLTDEDCSASGVRKADIPGTRVHGFAIERENPSLVRLAESTGGVGVENF